MMEIEKPRITCEETDNGCFARFVVEPLDRGFGITLGNCMRRVLLSALPGAAPIGIKINGVQHEFSTIKGVSEDVVDIVLNIKNLAVKSFDTSKDFTTVLRINKYGAGEVTAADFEPNDLVEILNPELHICSLDDGAKFELEVFIGRGRGYVPADANKKEDAPIGYIAVDSIFTPVKKVNYYVQNTRVEQSIDYDKLTIEVETDGTLSAREVISLSGKLIQDHISLFVDLVESMSQMDILVCREEDKQTKVLEMTIEDIDLSVRSYNCLKRANINTIEDLNNFCEDINDKSKVGGSKYNSGLLYPYFYSAYLYQPSVKNGEELDEQYAKGKWYAPSIGELSRIIYYRGYSSGGNTFTAKACKQEIKDNITSGGTAETTPIFSLALKEMKNSALPGVWKNIVGTVDTGTANNITTTVMGFGSDADNYSYQVYTSYGTTTTYEYRWMYGEFNTGWGWEAEGKNLGWRYTPHQGIPFVKYDYVNPTK